MKAGEAKLNSIFLTNKLLEIPFYQRSYVWGEEEWERLLEDLRGMCERNEEYFLGSVILKDSTITGSNKEKFASKYIVVDGQQRLTTLLILMKVIALINDDMETFDEHFIKRRVKDGIEAPYLRHSHKDRPSFERVLALTSLDEIDGGGNVIAAYNYFRTHVDTATAQCMDLELLTSLMVFVMITVYEDEDEQQIFDTINSLGVRLTTAELLKNYFFGSEDIALYRSSWEDVFEKDDETREYWDQEITTGRLKRSLIDIFFGALLQVLVEEPDIDVRDADRRSYEKAERLFKSYRDFIEIKRYRDKKYVLEVMRPYAELFRETFRPTDCESVVPPEPSVERIKVVIFGLQNSTLIPYVLYLRSRHADDEEAFEEMLGILEAYVMRRIITRGETNNYNRFFSGLMHDGVDTADKLTDKLGAGGDSSTSYPGDAIIRSCFHEERRLTSLQARGVLYLLETAMWPAGSSTKMLGFDSYSLEHLMPKKWRNHWKRLGDPEKEEERDRALLTLGNLAIIPQKLNAAIRDSSWAKKKAGTKKYDGLDLCAAGLRSLKMPLASDVWDEQHIDRRADELCGYALKTWHIDVDDEPDQEDGGVVPSDTTPLYCTGNGAFAMGYCPGGKRLVVVAGSTVSKSIAPSLLRRHKGVDPRDELVANGVITDHTFLVDHEFRTFSAAACIVLGRPANGRVEWVTGEGKQFG